MIYWLKCCLISRLMDHFYINHQVLPCHFVLEKNFPKSSNIKSLHELCSKLSVQTQEQPQFWNYAFSWP